MRKGDWKYLAGGDRQYLFNLATDPEEKHDLLAQNPELARDLRGQLKKWSEGLMPPGLGPEMAAAGQGLFDYYLDGKKNRQVHRKVPPEIQVKEKARRPRQWRIPPMPALMNNIRESFHLKLLPTKPVAKGKKRQVTNRNTKIISNPNLQG